MQAVDLFCGGGGWSLGATAAGCDVQAGYDNDADALATYTAAGFHGVNADLGSLRLPLPCDVLLGSPPCQPYSKAGKQQGRSDRRGMLPLVLAHWAEVVRPTAVAVEQVEGASSVINRVAAMLINLGYRCVLQQVDSEQFGVPQTRTRIVLMAHLHRTPGVPVPTHSRYYPRHPRRQDRGVLPWVSMAQALGWDDEDKVGFPRRADKSASIGAYRARDLRDATQPAFALTSKVRSWERWPFERPSPTIVGSFYPQIVAAPGHRTTHPRQDQPGSVEVTVAEAGVLQGFPVDYPWTGSPTSQYRQVGNAFPPPVAKAVLEALL